MPSADSSGRDGRGAPGAPEVRVLPDPAAVTSAARELVLALARDSIARRGRFTLALSGGSTPRALYTSLVGAPLDWERVQVFFGDERCVPPEHQDSNYRMAREAWLSKVPLLPTHVHRIYAESNDANAAAEEYSRELERVLTPAPGQLPRLDLVLLGLGADAHTASLFPHTRALTETKRTVVANDVPQLSARRITFTYPLINAARHVVFLVAGADKRPALETVLRGARDLDRAPAQGVAPRDGDLVWLVDRAASGES